MPYKLCFVFFTTFSLAIFRIPKVVAKKIQSLQARFLWEREKHDKKISWVRWEHICSPRSHGGLGIKDVCLFNEAFMAKWRWNLYHQK